MFLIRCAAVAAVLAALFAPASSGAQEPVQIDVVSVTEDVFPRSQALVTVDDAGAATTGGLTAADFTVSINGIPAQVLAAELASSQSVPYDLLIVMDASGSMQGPPIAAAKAAAKQFVAGLAPEDRVALVTFSTSVVVAQPFTTDRAAINAAIDGVSAAGVTALYEATEAAAVMIGSAPSPRRAVVFLSDGAQDGVSTAATAESAIRAASGVGVPFFVIGEGESVDAAYLGALAEQTRGRYLEAPDPSALADLYANVGRLLRSQYVVTFDAAAAAGTTDAAITVQLRTNAGTASDTTRFTPSPAFAEPDAAIAGLTPGETLREPRELTVTLSGAAASATSASYYVDGVNVFQSTTPPFTFVYDPDDFGGGEHAIRAEVAFGDTFVQSETISFTSVAAASSGGPGAPGVPLLPIGFGVGALVLIAIGARWLLIRIRHGATPEIVAPDQRIIPWAARHRSVTPGSLLPQAGDEQGGPLEDVGEPLGVLISCAGSDLGSEYVVGPRPVSIGSSRACGVHIDDPRLAAEEARVWVKNGALLLHKKTRLTVIASEGVSGGWTILEPGDTFEIGEHRYEFRLLPQTESPPDRARTDGAADAPPESPRITPLTPAAGGATAGRTRLTELMPPQRGGGDAPDERDERAS
ncbi:MAG TPA: VWA domain-containing protein [Dehalococcoidia bacterium]|nr:VWA domain-containing protein [Dehalococcoidia bacterium]